MSHKVEANFTNLNELEGFFSLIDQSIVAFWYYGSQNSPNVKITAIAGDNTICRCTANREEFTVWKDRLAKPQSGRRYSFFEGEVGFVGAT